MKDNRGKTKYYIITAVVLLVFAAFWLIFSVNKLEYVGNTRYDEDELSELIFGTKHPNVVAYMLFGEKKKDIPFIHKYDVAVSLPNKIKVTVKEKAVIGYVDYMGSYMYFDKDGMVVESSSKEQKGIPQIYGMEFSSIVLKTKLNTKDDQAFRKISEVNNICAKYGFEADKLYFNSQNEVTLTMGDVNINLGDINKIEEKFNALNRLKDKIADLKGTLDLSNYNGKDSSIIFKKEN